ncbi:MAG: flavodoxin family protein [Desulfonatronovibrionaceae bacterium]
MKVVSLLGSPRKKGNSSIMAEHLTSLLAEKHGAEIKSHHLNSLDFKGCQACFMCKTKSDKCVQKDDLAPVLEDAAGCDILILATPVYFGEVSAQLKGFIDRTFSYLVPDYGTSNIKTRLTPGKQLVFLISQGHPKEELFADIFPRYDYFFKWQGFTTNYVLRACGVYDKGAVDERKDIFSELKAIADSIIDQVR